MRNELHEKKYLCELQLLISYIPYQNTDKNEI